MMEPTDTPIRRAWRQIADAFEPATRDDGSPFVRIRETLIHDDLTDAVREAHDSGRHPPDDRTFATAQEIAEAMASLYDPADEDAPTEVLDQIPSTWPQDRFQWLAEAAGAREAVDEAIANLGYPDDISDAIAYGWEQWARWIFAPLAALAEGLAEELEAAELEAEAEAEDA